METQISTLCSRLHFSIDLIWSSNLAQGCREVQEAVLAHVWAMGIRTFLVQSWWELPVVLHPPRQTASHAPKLPQKLNQTERSGNGQGICFKIALLLQTKGRRYAEPNATDVTKKILAMFSLTTIQPIPTFILTQHKYRQVCLLLLVFLSCSSGCSVLCFYEFWRNYFGERNALILFRIYCTKNIILPSTI